MAASEITPRDRPRRPHTSASPLPPAVQAALVAPLYKRTVSVIAAHLAILGLNAMAIARIGGLWPAILLAANLVMLGVRVWMLLTIRRAPMRTPHDTLRWRRPYQAVGLAWTCLSSLLCAACIAVGQDDATRLLAIAMVLGIPAGFASRSAGTPRFAIAQLCIWLLPPMAATPLLGPWYCTLSLMAAVYLIAMCSIVRQHYADIVALISAEHSNAAHAMELRAMFDNAGAGIVEVDIASKRVVRVNRIYCAMLGRGEAELLADPDPTRLTHPDDRAEHARSTAAIARSGCPYDTEKRYLRADGSILWARLSVSVIAKNAAGRPTRVLAIVQDITERRTAEAALRASEELLRLSLDVGRIGIYRRDLTTGTLHCGRETRLMHGLPDDDVPVSNEAWVAMLLPEDQAELARQLHAAYAERRAVATFDYRFHHPTDGIRHIETRARIEYDETGRPIGSVGVGIDVTDRRAAEARIAHLAHHDPLTDLPNRSLFRVRLDDALARSRLRGSFAVLCVDLDHFKFVNDTLGHPVGDALLCAVTTRLLASVRPTDTVARLGGDEFAIIQADGAGPANTASMAERIIAAIAAPFDIEGHHIVIGASIGIAAAPGDAQDADTLLRNADMALYAAKSGDRGHYRFFETEMDIRAQARRTLEIDLRIALETEAFELFYQPLIGIADGTVRGFEALLRWHHPTRGLVQPDRFIPLAESIGLIVPIGDWALRRACRDAVRWPGAPRVAVNVSAVQFASQTLVESVAAALRESGLDPGRLEVEITESAMLNETEANLDTLHRLRALGVRIAMDDFGTGYSSLGYLLRFPFDKVKIDRAFIANLGQSRASAAIVGAVIGLCASLDMTTTAEGVETAAQLAALARIGCTEVQGFYFSPARPAAEIPALIATLTRNAEALLEAAD
jgi:diguanylate cyclase (GGDEF)-like protein/PAS domain S-box-containing protein